MDVFSGPSGSLLRRLSPERDVVMSTSPRRASSEKRAVSLSEGEAKAEEIGAVQATCAMEGVLGHSCLLGGRRVSTLVIAT